VRREVDGLAPVKHLQRRLDDGVFPLQRKGFWIDLGTWATSEAAVDHRRVALRKCRCQPGFGEFAALLRRLALAELSVAAGQPRKTFANARAGWAVLREHRSRFGSVDLRTGTASLGGAPGRSRPPRWTRTSTIRPSAMFARGKQAGEFRVIGPSTLSRTTRPRRDRGQPAARGEIRPQLHQRGDRGPSRVSAPIEPPLRPPGPSCVPSPDPGVECHLCPGQLRLRTFQIHP
jgi:hypothetical protein